MTRRHDHQSVGLQVVDIVKRFGEQTVVDRASLTVAPGEIVALLGPSGCGKTTTLRMIAGFETLDGGRVELGGQDIAGLAVFQRRIGLVFQDYALFPHMTVAQNIDYGMRKHGVPAHEREKRRSELVRLTRLDGLEARYPAALSGGQQQRVALARALAISPNLLLLDEPLSNLDAKLREALRMELRDILRTLAVTTLVVTHDQQEAFGIADRIAVMCDGRIVQHGTARTIYEEPETRFVAEFIGHSLWFSGKLSEPDLSRPPAFLCDDGNVLIVSPAAVRSRRQGVSIRPEHIHLSPQPGDTNHIAAHVERIEFFGPESNVHCKLVTGGRMISIPVRADETLFPAIGGRITLGIASKWCRLVSDA